MQKNCSHIARVFILCCFFNLIYKAKAQEIKKADSAAAVKELVINTSSSAISDTAKKNEPSEKYGFKNLFVHNGYITAESHASQLHPMAIPFVRDYLENNSTRLQKMKGWGEPYFKLIENILVKYNLPKELKYLAVIESDLKANAISWAGAVGPWQFMPETGRLMGLQINRWQDERTDLFKSTIAASRYLRDLYEQLNDWLLVIAAYNGGPARVETAIRKNKSRNFWQLQYSLPAESRNHVKKFIATHYIMEGQGGVTTTVTADINEVDLLQLSPEEKANTQTQIIRGKYNSLVITKNLGMDIGYFNRLNPGFDQKVSKDSFDLRLPLDKMTEFSSKKMQILNESVQLLLNSPVAEKNNYPEEIKLPAKKVSGKSKKKK